MSNVFLVRGFNRSLLQDLLRERFFVIPNSMADFIDASRNISINEFCIGLDSDDLNSVLGYIDFLKKHDLIHESDYFLDFTFPPIQLSYDKEISISNIILNLKKSDEHLLKRTIEVINEYEVRALQIHLQPQMSLNEIANFMLNLLDSPLQQIDVNLSFHTLPLQFDWEKFLLQNLRVGNVIVYDSPSEYQTAYNSNTSLVYNKKGNLDIHFGCGSISQKNFVSNLTKYEESLSHNSCLYGKLYIGDMGEIKNCPSTKRIYGNIKSSNLEDILITDEFRKLGRIRKDKISVCKDCEFRHVCTDCRAFLENPNDLYSKPLKCGYSPYTNLWDDWSASTLKQKVFYNYEIGFSSKDG